MATQKPHIMHLIDHLAPGGAERMVVDIANTTDKNKYRVSVCITRSNKTLAPDLDADIELLSLDKKARFDWKAFRHFSEFCKKEEVSLFHAHNGYSFLFLIFMKLIGKLRQSTPIVVHDHNGDVEIQSHFPFVYSTALRLNQPYYVGVHEKLSALAKKAGVAATRVFTIPNAINLEAYRKPKEGQKPALPRLEGDKGPVGILVSNIRPTKNIDGFIKTVFPLKELKWVIFIAGLFIDTVYSGYCKKLIKELGLEEKIIFLGPCQNIPEILKEADFGILASKSESGPLVLIEYLATGLPFVSTRVGLVGHDLDRQGVPEFVNPDDPTAFREAFKRLLLLTPEERKERGEKARLKTTARFDIWNVIQEWHAVYEKALSH